MSLVPPSYASKRLPCSLSWFIMSQIMTESLTALRFCSPAHTCAPPITHCSVAEASERRRGGAACAPGRSRSAPSGGALSASSSHPPFGSRRVAVRRSTPGEAHGHCKLRRRSEACWQLDQSLYLQAEALQHLVDGGLLPDAVRLVAAVGTLL